jgi:alpha-galactosidase
MHPGTPATDLHDARVIGMHRTCVTLVATLGATMLASVALTAERASAARSQASRPPVASVALKPPMGWNSYTGYGASVTEAEVKANADFMARRLLKHGWRYVVVDLCWSHPRPGREMNPDQREGFQPLLAMDEHGRLLPAVERFPSAAGGRGFRPLADYVHARGLRFGIHVMRGVPRQAVARRSPILGTSVTAADVADPDSRCPWLNHMYGIRMRRPGAQAYYDSLFQLYADWGVDYVKVDDISAPYSAPEIEAVRTAIDRSGRPMVLSLSPGPTSLEEAYDVRRHANLWRISADLWDDWPQLEEQFALCQTWARYTAPGAWPDADVLPLGRLSLRGPWPAERWTRLTHDEQVTLLTLQAIFRSPLMLGGYLPTTDDFTIGLVTNDEVIAVDQSSTKSRVLMSAGGRVVWAADALGRPDRYLAFFNLSDFPGVTMRVDLARLALPGRCRVRDLWKRQDVGTAERSLTTTLPAHGARLYSLTPLS